MLLFLHVFNMYMMSHSVLPFAAVNEDHGTEEWCGLVVVVHQHNCRYDCTLYSGHCVHHGRQSALGLQWNHRLLVFTGLLPLHYHVLVSILLLSSP